MPSILIFGDKQNCYKTSQNEIDRSHHNPQRTVYLKKYAHGLVVLCFVVVMQSFIMNSHEVFIHIHQGCFAGTGAIVRLPQCQWSKPDGYGKTSQCITTTKHSKAKTVCIFLGIYCKRLTLGNFHSISPIVLSGLEHRQSNIPTNIRVHCFQRTGYAILFMTLGRS